MNKPLAFSGNNGQSCGSANKERRELPPQLRRQARIAEFFLFACWLVSVYFWLLFFFYKVADMFTLLPGLLIWLHLHRQLRCHLTKNHHPDEKNRFYSTLGAGNWITLARGCGVIILAGFLPFAVLPEHERLSHAGLVWAPGIIYLLISLADVLDGFIARKQDQVTELGKRLDIETDAAGLLIASLLAVTLDCLPLIYLVTGFAYYLFIFGIWLRHRQDLPVTPLLYRPYSRIIAGCQMGLVGMVLLPIFTPPFTFIAGSLFMTPLLLGFLRDWLVVSGWVEMDATQQTRLDRFGGWLKTRVVLPFRLILLLYGIVAFTPVDIFQVPTVWQLVFNFCCLLAGIGCMGRSTALLLILLLASNQSPFGISSFSQMVFCSAVILVLFGTGPMSLFTPEDGLLYRYKTNATKGII